MSKTKHLSKNKQRELLLKEGYSRKDINRMHSETRLEISKLIIADRKYEQQQKTIVQRVESKAKNTKEKRKIQYLNRITKKRFALLDMGFSDAMVNGKFSNKKIDSIKLSDLESGNITKINYPWLYDIDESFDYDKLYKVPDGKGLRIIYRSLDGNINIEDALKVYSQYTNEELIVAIEELKNRPLGGKGSGSNGKPGEAMVDLKSFEALKENLSNRKEENKASTQWKNLLAKNAKKKGRDFNHKAIDFHWQFIKQKDGEGNYYTDISARKLLIICASIMDNIVEKDRKGFYESFVTEAVKIIPEMEKILP